MSSSAALDTWSVMHAKLSGTLDINPGTCDIENKTVLMGEHFAIFRLAGKMPIYGELPRIMGLRNDSNTEQ